MQLVKVHAIGIVNSFRNYARTTIHDTLPLPPKTTIIGLLGGALGYGFNSSELLELYDKVKVGIVGKSKSNFYDLMRVFKLKGKDSVPGLLQRQLNWENRYWIYYYYGDRNRKILDALRNPVFAPTLGLADELINIKDVLLIEAKEIRKGERATFSNTLLPFKLDPSSTDVNWPEGEEDIIVPLTPYRVPIKFEFDSKGSRKPIDDADYVFTDRMQVSTIVPEEFTACQDGEFTFVLH